MTVITKENINSPKTDEERMREDRWNFLEFDYIPDTMKPLSQVSGYWVVDFSCIADTGIREELKTYYAHVINDRTRNPQTLANTLFYIHWVLQFLSGLELKKSLLNYPLDRLQEKYIRFLKDHGKVTKSRIRQIHGTQVVHTYVEYSSLGLELKAVYNYLSRKQLAGMSLSEKDVWDLRELPFKVEGISSRPRFMLNFEHISQLPIRKVFKRYVYERLKTRKLSTVFCDFKAVNLFSDFLMKYYPDLQHLREVDRNIITHYFSYIDSKNFATTTSKSRKSLLKQFLELSYFMGIEDVPQQELIFRDDFRKAVKLIPKTIPNEVLWQLNRELPHLPYQLQTMILLLENVGMRVNELCQLSIDCLKRDYDGFYFIEYYQGKTRCYNRVPVSDAIADRLQKQRGETLERFPLTRLMFTINGKTPYPQESLSNHLNQLSYKYHIMDENGKSFHFRLHQFRHTVAMQYAQAGMTPYMISCMLGHKSIKSIMSYVELNDLMADKKLEVFWNKEENYLAKILSPSDGNEEDQAVRLTNGYCMNAGDLCEDAVICYNCSMFSADHTDKKLLQDYASALRNKIPELEMKGMERECQVYKKLLTELDKVLRMPKEMDDL